MRKCSASTVVLDLVTDNYGEETSWMLRDYSGAVMASGSGYSSNTNSFDGNCVPNEACFFTILDSWGDGICCGYGFGSYSITRNGVETIGDAEFLSTHTVNICPSAPTPTPPTPTPPTPTPPTPTATTCGGTGQPNSSGEPCGVNGKYCWSPSAPYCSQYGWCGNSVDFMTNSQCAYNHPGYCSGCSSTPTTPTPPPPTPTAPPPTPSTPSSSPFTMSQLRAGLNQFGYSVNDPPQAMFDAVNDATQSFDLYKKVAFAANTLWETGAWQAVAETCATTGANWCHNGNTSNNYQSCLRPNDPNPVFPGAPTSPASGQQYYGRGLVQLSWCFNYLQYGYDRYTQGINPSRFWSPLQFYYDPDLILSDPYYIVDTAVWAFEGYEANGRLNGNFGDLVATLNGCHECTSQYVPTSTCPSPVPQGGYHQDVATAMKRYNIFKAIADQVGLTGYSESGCYN